MKKILDCRRSVVALVAIMCLTSIALLKGIDSSMSIAAVAVGLAGANSAEGFMKKPELPRPPANN